MTYQNFSYLNNSNHNVDSIQNVYFPHKGGNDTNELEKLRVIKSNLDREKTADILKRKDIITKHNPIDILDNNIEDTKLELAKLDNSEYAEQISTGNNLRQRNHSLIVKKTLNNTLNNIDSIPKDSTESDDVESDGIESDDIESGYVEEINDHQDEVLVKHDYYKVIQQIVFNLIYIIISGTLIYYSFTDITKLQLENNYILIGIEFMLILSIIYNNIIIKNNKIINFILIIIKGISVYIILEIIQKKNNIITTNNKIVLIVWGIFIVLDSIYNLIFNWDNTTNNCIIQKKNKTLLGGDGHTHMSECRANSKHDIVIYENCIYNLSRIIDKATHIVDGKTEIKENTELKGIVEALEIPLPYNTIINYIIKLRDTKLKYKESNLLILTHVHIPSLKDHLTDILKLLNHYKCWGKSTILGIHI